MPGPSASFKSVGRSSPLPPSAPSGGRPPCPRQRRRDIVSCLVSAILFLPSSAPSGGRLSCPRQRRRASSDREVVFLAFVSCRRLSCPVSASSTPSEVSSCPVSAIGRSVFCPLSSPCPRQRRRESSFLPSSAVGGRLSCPSAPSEVVFFCPRSAPSEVVFLAPISAVGSSSFLLRSAVGRSSFLPPSAPSGGVHFYPVSTVGRSRAPCPVESRLSCLVAPSEVVSLAPVSAVGGRLSCLVSASEVVFLAPSARREVVFLALVSARGSSFLPRQRRREVVFLARQRRREVVFHLRLLPHQRRREVVFLGSDSAVGKSSFLPPSAPSEVVHLTPVSTVGMSRPCPVRRSSFSCPRQRRREVVSLAPVSAVRRSSFLPSSAPSEVFLAPVSAVGGRLSCPVSAVGRSSFLPSSAPSGGRLSCPRQHVGRSFSCPRQRHQVVFLAPISAVGGRLFLPLSRREVVFLALSAFLPSSAPSGGRLSALVSVGGRLSCPRQAISRSSFLPPSAPSGGRPLPPAPVGSNPDDFYEKVKSILRN
ncbi:hypothetical protein C7M84_013677 [Penaeus vannamei]|uniref:Uncharacterized protein n=1 Tax=Penaeus vannamei TaxID=6689 RepID=A0A3R7R028_PENVA|nr:hypothetical protein C7M84_013677 [Penaeus vannamei]